jgi:hypothetical protein
MPTSFYGKLSLHWMLLFVVPFEIEKWTGENNPKKGQQNDRMENLRDPHLQFLQVSPDK